MDDEIKEILRDLEFASGIFDYTITPDRCTFLKDYITNLQTIEREYSPLLSENAELQQENTELKEYLKIMEKGKDNNLNRFLNYKSRIEKAVEYIENTPLYETTYDYNMEEELEIQNVSDETASNKLLEILNGRSDE